jgi:hypothetical protein
VVYVARNPKDVIVSYFYHHKLIEFHNFTGDIETFAQYFMDDERNLRYFYLDVLKVLRLTNICIYSPFFSIFSSHY